MRPLAWQSTINGQVLLLDAFKGDLIQSFQGHDNARGLPLEACFSADAEYIVAGSEDGGISGGGATEMGRRSHRSRGIRDR